MIYWAYVSLTVAVTAGLVGFGGRSEGTTVIAQTLFFVFLATAALLIAIKFLKDEARDREEERQNVPQGSHR